MIYIVASIKVYYVCIIYIWADKLNELKLAFAVLYFKYILYFSLMYSSANQMNSQSEALTIVCEQQQHK